MIKAPCATWYIDCYTTHRPEASQAMGLFTENVQMCYKCAVHTLCYWTYIIMFSMNYIKQCHNITVKQCWLYYGHLNLNGTMMF